MIVIDASAVIELLLETDTGERVRAKISRRGESLHAPHLIDLEVAQVLRRFEMVRAMTPARALEALKDMDNVVLLRYSHDILLERIWQLRGNLSTYDAAYIALAEALEAPLLTCDRTLGATRGHRARVEVL